MEELVKSDMKTPIEIALGVDENGTTTARTLYEFFGTCTGSVFQMGESQYRIQRIL